MIGLMTTASSLPANASTTTSPSLPVNSNAPHRDQAERARMLALQCCKQPELWLHYAPDPVMRERLLHSGMKGMTRYLLDHIDD